MSTSTGSRSSVAITSDVPFFSRLDGACTTSGRGRSEGGTGVNGRKSSPGGITCASGTQRCASYEPTISASARLPYASSSRDFPRMSEPR